MPKFEDFGRKLDRELEKLRDVAEKKISPATRNRAAKSLRAVSDALTRIAQDLESESKPADSTPKEQ